MAWFYQGQKCLVDVSVFFLFFFFLCRGQGKGRRCLRRWTGGRFFGSRGKGGGLSKEEWEEGGEGRQRNVCGDGGGGNFLFRGRNSQ